MKKNNNNLSHIKPQTKGKYHKKKRNITKYTLSIDCKRKKKEYWNK